MGTYKYVPMQLTCEKSSIGKAEVVKNLLSTGKFSISKIANFANVSEVFVRKVKKQ